MSQDLNSLLRPQSNSEAAELLDEKMEQITLQAAEQSTRRQAEQLGLSYRNLTGLPIGPEVIGIIPEDAAKEAETLCFFHGEGKIFLATIDPDNPEIKNIIADLQRRFPNRHIILHLVSNHSFEQAFKLYQTVAKIYQTTHDIIIEPAALDKYQKTIISFGDLQQNLKNINISDTFTLIIASALNFDASDIHIEAEETEVKVRYRLDGVLHDVASLPITLWPRIISRLKALARIKINIKDEPQDGRITIKLPKENVDIRVSTLPSAYGESVVMRLLRSGSVNLSIEKLGLRPGMFKILKAQIERPNGMILTTGPTGSGKTTTLYAILNNLNNSETKIITLEDPIEYKVKSITQSQVDHTKGYTFPKGLRAILRQDPDIVMVGEIRDLETADTAIQAALTGHLMLSTVHTNDSAGAVPRLLSMGVKPFLLSPALNMVIGQRLVRQICPDCKVEETLNPSVLDRVKKLLDKIPTIAGIQIDTNNLKFYKGQGCTKCHKLGYRGRLGIFELFVIDRDIEAVILSQEISEYSMRDAATSKGMLTMVQDGLLKALEGLTSVDEVFRVTE